MTYSYDPDRAITANPDFYGKPTGGYNNPAPGKSTENVEFQTRMILDTHTGKKYRTIQGAANDTGIKYTRIFSECRGLIVSATRFEYIGELLQEIDGPKKSCNKRIGKAVMVNGVKYPSITMACQTIGINKRTGFKKINKGEWKVL